MTAQQSAPPLVTETSLASTPFTSGGDYVGGSADSGGQPLAPAIQVNPWAAPPFDFDWPCLPRELRLHLQQAGELSFQRGAQKRLSLWTKRLHPYIKGEAWHWALRRHGYDQSWKKVLSPNSYFPKPVDIRCPLYHDKGNRTVNGVA